MFSPIVEIADEIASATVSFPMRAAAIASRSGAGLQRDVRDHLDEALELLVPRDEISLGIDLDDDAFPVRHRDTDQTFGGNTARLLGSLG